MPRARTDDDLASYLMYPRFGDTQRPPAIRGCSFCRDAPCSSWHGRQDRRAAVEHERGKTLIVEHVATSDVPRGRHGGQVLRVEGLPRFSEVKDRICQG